MPNHVTNIVSFKGDQSKIQDLIDSVRSKDSEFDFHTFCPMPQELRGSRSPTSIVSQEDYDKYMAKDEKNDWDKCITQQMSDDLIMQHGADNWYDWSIMNWGTKWNAYDINFDGSDFSLQTAWSTPFNAMHALSEKFPHVTICVKYFDEDFGNNTGEYHLKNGDVVYEYMPDPFTEEAFRFAIDIEGGDYYFSDALADADGEFDVHDTFYSTCIKINHDKNYPFDNFPDKILEKLLEYAIGDEQYERANKIKELLKK